MRNFAILAFAAVALALSGCKPSEEKAPETQASGQSVPQGDGFDFYVLSLSWSPSYCEAEGESANRQQCSSRRPYTFVVHGLWPQFERGYPENCDIRERDVDQQTLRGLYDIMPSAGLIRHQWRKHGSCAGLSQSDYFEVLRAARERIEIPTAFQNPTKYETVSPNSVENAFLEANSGLKENGIAVSCDNRYLREVRICLTKDLQFRACEEVDRRACRRDRVVMPPARGG